MQGGTVQQARSRTPRNPCFTAGNRLTQLTQATGTVNNTAQTVSFAYDSGNRRTQTTLANGVATGRLR